MIDYKEPQFTNIIALSPLTLPHNHIDSALFEKIGDYLNPWLHLTLAQYDEAAISPIICHHLKKLVSNLSAFSIEITRLDYWPKSQVIYLRVHKNRSLIHAYRSVKNIFCNMLPGIYLKNWYVPIPFWTPHITIAYNIDSALAMSILPSQPIEPFHIVIDTITIRDYDTNLKEFRLNEKP